MMEIETERLLLRNYSSDDIENLFLLKSEPKVWTYSDKTVVHDLEEVRPIIEAILNNYINNKCGFQALFLKSTKEYVGEAGILSTNSRCNRSVIGYNLLPQYWGYGFATEITKALVSYLFEECDLERIEALAGESNIASRRVLEKSGLKLEGILRNFAYIDNTYINVHYFGMIRGDYFTTSH